MQGIFLDRDGVINRERADYVKNWDEFVFLPRALPALRILAKLKVPTFIVTNQSVIGRQIVSRSVVDAIHQKMLNEISTTGIRIRDILLCPHHPNDGCTCRKPEPGMLTTAAATHNLDLSQCLFIGDSITDYQAAQSCGCRSALLRSGRQGKKIDTLLQACKMKNAAENDFLVPIFDDLFVAAQHLTN